MIQILPGLPRHISENAKLQRATISRDISSKRLKGGLCRRSTVLAALTTSPHVKTLQTTSGYTANYPIPAGHSEDSFHRISYTIRNL